MKKIIRRINPLQLAKTLAIIYAFLSIVAMVFMLLSSISSKKPHFMSVLVIFMPLVYAAMGLVTGVIVAAIYNFSVKWTGGIEITLEDAE